METKSTPKTTAKNGRNKTKVNPNDMKNMLNKAKNQGSVFNNVFFYAIVFFVGYLLLTFIFGSDISNEKRPINEAIALINESKVADITISGDNLDFLLKDGTKFTTKKETSISFDDILKNNNIDRSKISGKITVDQKLGIEEILSSLFTFGLPLLVLFFIFRQMRGASEGVFSFGKSRARLFNKGSSKITFNDVAGVDEAKKDMMEIVDFLKNPEKYRKLGARIPKGVLLVGPSGVGKTLLAKAIAGEAGVPFFSAAGSEFMEMLVGVGSSRVRDLFAMAKASQPSLIFIDEIDAIGRQRGMGIGGGHDEREQTLNQILTEMDGFDPRTDVIVIAATNRADMLDPALVRAGRFDRRISIPLPDIKDRVEILKIHVRGKPLATDVDLEKVARKTVGFSGADLENMLNEAAIIAAAKNSHEISFKDIDNASLKVTIGAERKTLQTDEEKKLTAYHEAGHAVVGHFMPQMDPVVRVSIIPRGSSLGHTSINAETDRYNETKTRLMSYITMMLGGRSAEELVFNELTTGASNDLERATELARKMVTEYGMSNLGPVSYDGNNGAMWLARQMGEGAQYSQEVAAKIDNEVKIIMDTAHAAAIKLLTEKRSVLDKVSALLLERETIDADEFKEIVSTV